MAQRERGHYAGLQRLLVSHLTTTMSCPECLNNYQGKDILILGHERSLWILAAICDQCHTQGLVFVIVKEDPPLPPPTELTPEEIERFSCMPAISIDDVLDIRLALDRLEDDFFALWEEETHE